MSALFVAGDTEHERRTKACGFVAGPRGQGLPGSLVASTSLTAAFTAQPRISQFGARVPCPGRPSAQKVARFLPSAPSLRQNRGLIFVESSINTSDYSV